MLLSVDDPVPPDILEQIRGVADLQFVKVVRI
jgi:hypothetical protein